MGRWVLVGWLVMASVAVAEEETRLVCFDTRTGEPVNDFQSAAAPGTLIANAVKAGLGPAEAFVERAVTVAEYQTIERSVNGPIRARRRAEVQAQASRRREALQTLKTQAGLTDEQLEALFPQ